MPAAKTPRPAYSIGIDLGTTNSALAFREFGEGDGVSIAGIPQLVNVNEVAAEPLLPSFLDMPGEREFPAGATKLPWDSEAGYIVGRLAQRRGAEVSGAVWFLRQRAGSLYSAIDRSAAMLPLNFSNEKAADGVTRISPVDASAAYLRHLRMAWEHEHPGCTFRHPGSTGHDSGIVRRRRTRAHGKRLLTLPGSLM